MLALGEEIERWAFERCEYRDRAWGSVAMLYRDLVDWAQINRRHVSLSEKEFIFWAYDQGFQLDLSKRLVYGMVMMEDVAIGCVLHPDVIHGVDRG